MLEENGVTVKHPSAEWYKPEIFSISINFEHMYLTWSALFYRMNLYAPPSIYSCNDPSIIQNVLDDFRAKTIDRFKTCVREITSRLNSIFCHEITSLLLTTLNKFSWVTTSPYVQNNYKGSSINKLELGTPSSPLLLYIANIYF